MPEITPAMRAHLTDAQVLRIALSAAIREREQGDALACEDCEQDGWVACQH